MKTTRKNLIYSSSLLIFTLALCQGAPRKPLNTYDQRQDGKLNVHAKFENLLFVVAPSSLSATTPTELADFLPNDFLQSLGQKSHIDDDSDEKTGENVEAKFRGEKPQDGSEDSIDHGTAITRTSNKEIAKRRGIESERGFRIIAIVQKNIPIDLAASEQLTETNVKDNDEDTEDEPIVNSTHVHAEEKASKTTRSLQKSSVHSSVSKLPPTENTPAFENKVAIIGTNESGKALQTSENREPQELKLLGDGIENCGPESYRDSSGICRIRKND